jgi:hypothetical protein
MGSPYIPDASVLSTTQGQNLTKRQGFLHIVCFFSQNRDFAQNFVFTPSVGWTNLSPGPPREYMGQVLSEDQAADRVFADAAEVELAVVFDRVGDLGVTVWRVVLEVVDDAALRIKAQDK